MGKQSMGTPVQNFPYRTDNKLYRLQTGQTPVVRPKVHDDYGVDGCNAAAMETMAGDDDNGWVAVVVFEKPEFMSLVARPKVSVNHYHELAIPMLLWR